jgi:serine protease AprX
MMSDEISRAARGRVHDTLGPDVATKASDAFCRAFAGAAAPPGTFPSTDEFRSVSPSAFPTAFLGVAPADVGNMPAGVPPLVQVVIEMEPVEPPFPALNEAVKRMRESGPWAAARASAVHALGARADASLAARAEALMHPALLMREIYVKEMRERALAAMSPVRGKLEQSVMQMFAQSTRAMGAAGLPASPTQVCWLNQTIRTWADPRALGPAAADRNVRSIDLPQELHGEIRETGITVGAVPYRAATSRMGNAIIVAVIDSEVSLTHPALRGRVIHRRNFTREPWGSPGPHGTAVAGIIAAQGEEPFVGMAPGAVIYNYKVLTTSLAIPAEDFDLACALQQALEDGARIANCSVESKTPADGRSRLVRACDNAWALGMTIVKSAGNKGEQGDRTITCPGDAQGVIVVGATGRNGQNVTAYSSRGPIANKTVCPDLVAPGGNDKDRVLSCSLDGHFGEIDPGTSLAAPHVTGLLAVILEGRPDLTPDEQRELLFSLCDAKVMGEVNAEGRGKISIAALD